LADEELTPEQIVEQIKRLKVSDVLLSTVTTVAQLGYAKLEEDAKDLDQARLAIEVLSAIIPLLDTHIPQEISRDLHAMLANLQLAYANAAKEPVD
jgi:hypothetical protein